MMIISKYLRPRIAVALLIAAATIGGCSDVDTWPTTPTDAGVSNRPAEESLVTPDTAPPPSAGTATGDTTKRGGGGLGGGT